MAQLRPKQIKGFEVTNTSAFNDGTQIVANEQTFASTAAIQNEFIPEQSLIIEQFTGVSFPSSTQGWNITLMNPVQNNSADMVTVFVNGVKLMDNATEAVTGNVVKMAQLSYDIDSIDIIEVHYVETHSV